MYGFEVLVHFPAALGSGDIFEFCAFQRGFHNRCRQGQGSGPLMALSVLARHHQLNPPAFGPHLHHLRVLGGVTFSQTASMGMRLYTGYFTPVFLKIGTTCPALSCMARVTKGSGKVAKSILPLLNRLMISCGGVNEFHVLFRGQTGFDSQAGQHITIGLCLPACIRFALNEVQS